MTGQDFDFDLFVIGAGSAGVRAARIASQAGARVGIAEEYRTGGTCVIRGCVPKKLMVFASGFSEAFEHASSFGWHVGEPTFDWVRFIAAKDAEISRLEAIYQHNLTAAGARLFPSRAVVVDPHRVRLASGQEHSARIILIATGGHPVLPDIEGVELGVTSNEMFNLPRQPGRVLVVGGGYIACEFAGILNGLGSYVHQVYRGEQILRGFDTDLRDHLADAMRGRGVTLETGRDVSRIEKVEGELRVTFDNGATSLVDLVMFATGRGPNTKGLGLAEAGVRLTSGGAVEVDDWSQTSVPSIYAAGDVTGREQLTPVAIREGHAFADTVFGGTPVRFERHLIPTAVFTQPEIGTVGLTEDQARAKGPVQIYKTSFRPILNVLSGKSERTLMKLVIDANDRKVLGCHLIGPGSGELIQAVAIAVRMGATKEDFDRTVAVHPTVAEELVTMRTPVA